MSWLKTKQWNVVVLAMTLMTAAAWPSGSAWVQEAEGVVDQIKTAFDQAMAKPLADRVSLLETLEQNIDDHLFEGTLTGKDRSKGLYYKFWTQQQLAKYPQSYQTYATYIRSIADCSNLMKAQSTFLADTMKWKRQREYAQCASVCEEILKEFNLEPDIAATALYYMALSKFHMNGTKKESMALCDKLIAQHFDSQWRPKAIRLLANSYAGYANFNAAVSTLSLLKTQYPNTRFARYADMRVASYYEYLKGDPQKALAVYQESLERYPDTVYAHYIHQQIKRLQGVIEEQLIQDALEGIVGADVPTCDTSQLIVRILDTRNSKMARSTH